MSGIKHKHDPSSEKPPRKFKPGNKHYTEEFKDWFSFHTKDLLEWKAFVAFCRKHTVDPQNSSYWRRQRYPEIFKGPKTRAQATQKVSSKKVSLHNKTKGQLKILIEEERAKVIALEKQIKETDIGETMKLAEEAEAALNKEREEHKQALQKIKSELDEAKTQVSALLEEAATTDAKNAKKTREELTKVNKDYTGLQKKYNELVKQCRECEEKVKHHNDVLASLSALRREKDELDGELASLRASLADDTLFEKKDEEIARLRKKAAEDDDTIARKEQVLDLLKEENEKFRADNKRLTDALVVAEEHYAKAREAAETRIDGVTVATIFWAGALSTGVMPDPVDAAPEIRRLIERLNAGDV